MACAECGAVFTAYRPGQKFCSAQCRNASKYRRRKPARNAKYAQENPRVERISNCEICGCEIANSHLGKLRRYCRGEECQRERVRRTNAEWRAKNRDKSNGYARAWSGRNAEKRRELSRIGRHRRRAREAGNGVFVISDRDQARLDASACVQCGSWDRLEEDHIVPVSRGGAHSIGNLQILCLSCNGTKNNRLQVEWLVARGELDERIGSASS